MKEEEEQAVNGVAQVETNGASQNDQRFFFNYFRVKTYFVNIIVWKQLQLILKQ